MGTLGKNLKEVFGGASNAHIARVLGTSDAAVGNYVNKNRIPEPPVLIKIHEETGCSLNWLLFDEGPKYVKDIKYYSIEDLTQQLLKQLNQLPSFDRHYYSLQLIDAITQNSKRRLKESMEKQVKEGEEVKEATHTIPPIPPPQLANSVASALGEKGLLPPGDIEKIKRGVSKHEVEIIKEKEKRARKARRPNKGRK